MRVLLILGSAKLAATFVLIGWTVLAGAPVGSAELPGWFHLSLLVAFAGAGSALLLMGDARARWLGVGYILFATIFADPLLRPAQALGGFGQSAGRALLVFQPVAFVPLAFWLFARRFPHRHAPPWRDRRAFGLACLVVGGALFLLSLLAPFLGTTGVGRMAAFASPHADPSQFWSLIVVLLVPAFVSMAVAVRRAAPPERRRLTLFMSGITIGALPIIAEVLLTSLIPAVRHFFDDPVRSRVMGAIEGSFLMLLPLATAWAVVVEPVFDVRFIVRRTLQYALARYTVLSALAVPAVALSWIVWRYRTVPLGELVLHAPLTGWLLAGGAVLCLLVVRRPLLTAIDRHFFRDQYDAQRILIALADGIRRAPATRDLATLLATELDRALHVERVSVVVNDPTGVLLRDPQGRVRPLASKVPLCTLLAGSSAPLDVDLADAASVFARLSQTEREWLSDVGARLLVPILGERGTLVGVLVLGEKRSELPFSNEDRMLLSAVAASASFALESRVHAETPGRARAAETVGEGQAAGRQCARCGQIARQPGSRCAQCDSPLREASIPAVVAGKFALERQIGAGGMGVVYRASDLELGRPVALKTLPRVSPENASRLRREARAMASLEHPNLAIIHGFEAWRGIPILVLEYLQGGTLHDRLRRGTLGPEEAVALGTAIADALEYLHRRGLLHRDVKPSNIGYTADAVPKLLDFGLVHLTAQLGRSTAEDTTVTGVGWIWRERSSAALSDAALGIAGTPAYLSPEALQRRSPDPSFDLWGLGVTLYEALAGVNPFRGTHASDVFALIQRAAPKDVRELCPGCPRELASFLARTLALDSAERPASAAEFRRQLRATLASETPGVSSG